MCQLREYPRNKLRGVTGGTPLSMSMAEILLDRMLYIGFGRTAFRICDA